MVIIFNETKDFELKCLKIKNYLYDSVLEIEKDENLAYDAAYEFYKSLDNLNETLTQIYQNPGPNDAEGIKSFPIRKGRYRVFYKIRTRDNNFEITMIDIDDNKQSNLDRFPSHRLVSLSTDGEGYS